MNSVITVCVDFDDTIHAFGGTWRGTTVITDGPVTGAIPALLDYLTEFAVAIHTTRFNDDLARVAKRAVADWLVSHGIPPAAIVLDGDTAAPAVGQIRLCSTKPVARLYIDDSAWPFRGRFPSRAEIRTYRPWNTQEQADAASDSAA